MRIDPKEQIADVEILKVRDFLRRVNNTDEWEDDFVVDRLKISPKKANRLINELNRRGYIEPIRFLMSCLLISKMSLLIRRCSTLALQR